MKQVLACLFALLSGLYGFAAHAAPCTSNSTIRVAAFFSADTAAYLYAQGHTPDSWLTAYLDTANAGLTDSGVTKLYANAGAATVRLNGQYFCCGSTTNVEAAVKWAAQNAILMKAKDGGTADIAMVVTAFGPDVATWGFDCPDMKAGKAVVGININYVQGKPALVSRQLARVLCAKDATGYAFKDGDNQSNCQAWWTVEKGHSAPSGADQIYNPSCWRVNPSDVCMVNGNAALTQAYPGCAFSNGMFHDPPTNSWWKADKTCGGGAPAQVFAGKTALTFTCPNSTVINRVSTPNKTWNGRATGVSGTNDNAATMNALVNAASCYRSKQAGAALVAPIYVPPRHP